MSAPTVLQLLTFTELESTTSFRLSRFLTFNRTGIASHEAFSTESSFIFSIDFHQSASNCKTQCLRLSGETATAEIYFDVVLFSNTQLVQRLFNYILKNA